jgi:hypothetical protein
VQGAFSKTQGYLSKSIKGTASGARDGLFNAMVAPTATNFHLRVNLRMGARMQSDRTGKLRHSIQLKHTNPLDADIV